jgi:hypothetical protein
LLGRARDVLEPQVAGGGGVIAQRESGAPDDDIVPDLLHAIEGQGYALLLERCLQSLAEGLRIDRKRRCGAEQEECRPRKDSFR